MTIPVWPSDLPPPLIGSEYSEALGDGRLKTPMDSGPPKMRRRSTAAVRTASITLRLTNDMRGRLSRFWAEDTAGGSLPFLMPDPLQNGVPLLVSCGVVLENDDGQPLLNTALLLVLFGDSPPTFTTRNRGRSIDAAFSVSILP